MKKKDLIFYAGAAVLMAVSAQGVSADELVSNEATTTEGNQVQAEKAPEVAVAEKSVAPIASNYAAPANVTEPAVAPASKVAASESGTPSVEKAVEASTTEKEETPLPSDTGSTTFFNTGTHAPAGRSTDVAVQPKSFVDVSSHNGEISIGDYRTLANKGVGGVVVKLTEDTWYKNPNAENQIRNAQAAGLQVSTYHFSRYTSEEAARTEARFYIAAAQRLNLPKNTLMVNDFEDAKMQPNINRTTQAWADEMRKNGYTNLMFYTSASWLDENNLRKKGPVNTSQFGLQNFWVAQYPSPKLSVNDAKSLRYNGKAGAWQFTSQAELLPGKHLFDHSVDYTGRFTANAKPAADPTEGSLSGKIDIVNNDTMTGRFDVVISNVKAPNGVRTVSVPIWSETGGQDDLVWYTANRQANGTYTVNVKAADHKNSTGLYNIHLYYVQNNGQMTGVGGTTTTVAIGKKNQTPVSADLTIAKSEKDGTFTITAKNLQGFDGYKEVKIPFWSHANGMKDIIWYTPTRQADGSYTVTAKASDHENADGKYEAQVFYVDAKGQNKFVKKAFIDYTASKPSADLTITKSEKDGTFTITAKNLQGFDGYKEVKIPFWSHANGMKDIIWYTPTRQADGSYTVTAKASDHENADGKYEAQVFYVDVQGQNKFVKKAFIDYKNQSRPTGTLLIQNNNKDTGTFDVIIKDVYSPKGVQTVQVPSWSDKDGQDDIRWYEATRQANGDYKVSVKASDHKNSTGKYHIHLYYIQNDGSRVGVGSTTTEVEFRNAQTKTQAAIKNVNSGAGTFTVTVDQAPQGRQIKNIRVAAWSKAHQENLYWYSATPTGMHTEITVSANNHGNEAGNYTTHVYVDYKDGGVEGFNLGQTALSPRNQKVNPQTTYYSQRDPRWGAKWYGVSNMDQSGCVPTSLAMAFTDILGREVLPTTVADYLYYNTNSFNKIAVAGTDADGLVAATKHWGLTSQMLTGKDAIAATLVSGKHVLAAVEESIFINAPYTHEIVLQGYDNGKTYVRDPFNPANNGWHSIDYIFSVKSTDPIDAKLGSPFFSVFA
ncbi:GBS Bsp-like repeat-containing protein [Streptococcus australis]|uniref:GBS Bsp-like repeat-containing protein n=2 Tax=Streptococcus australis TaxID=113107 RepID=UPI00100ED3E4|nr:GBS Bsp-like repeat-containing protein [Streptococcus australis]MDB8643818.1 GBS Bsp-like repeat-containing protein [Streptococcus australis]RXV52755.1 glycosyl hydrolase family 25 [Streptococcus australis]